MSGQDWLAMAVELAERNAIEGQLPFGAVVVREGELLAQGVNTTLRDTDPTAHAEVAAIRAAALAVGSLRLDGAEVFSNCEPCAMCQATGVSVGVTRMTFAMSSAAAAELGFPAPALAARMQDAWRAAAPGFTVGVGTPTAATPFRQWMELNGKAVPS